MEPNQAAAQATEDPQASRIESALIGVEAKMGGSGGESPRAPTAHDFPGLLEAVGATQI